MAVFHRTVTDLSSGDVYHFASVDGDIWIKVDSKPAADDHDAIIDRMNGNGRTKPMTVATRWFDFGLGDWAVASEAEEL